MDAFSFADKIKDNIAKGVGSVDIAVINFKMIPEGNIQECPPVTPKKSGSSTFGDMKGSFSVSSLAETAAKGAAKAALSTGASMVGLDMDKIGMGSKGPENTFVVQYNPASISFSATGTIPYKTNQTQVNEEGDGKPPRKATAKTFMNVNDVHMTMSVELIFEDIDKNDAFVEEKLKPISGDAVQSLGKTAVKALGFGKNNHSIRDQIQALVFMARNNSLQCTFNWGKISVSGQMHSLNVNYEMFSPKGEPIYATARMELELLAGRGAMPYWDEVYQDSFGQGTGHLMARDLGSAGNNLSKVGNVLKVGL